MPHDDDDLEGFGRTLLGISDEEVTPESLHDFLSCVNLKSEGIGLGPLDAEFCAA